MFSVPRVGVGVIIRNGNKVLLLKRKGAHGEGTWAFVGGNLELFESIEDCARREVYEEIGIELKKVKSVFFTNDIFEKEKKHYVTIFVVADFHGEEIGIKELDKIEELRWFEWRRFPGQLFEPLNNLLKTDFDPFVFSI